MAGEGSQYDHSVPELIQGILSDMQTLVVQHVQLAKHEMQAETRKILKTGMVVMVGSWVGLVGIFLLIIMLVHLLNTASELPLWACYAIVGGSFGAVGLGLVIMALRRFKTIHVIPARTLESAKENVRWFTHLATSNKM